ncbi:PREDICTED: 39S ribosomal protein L21, mitochondrial isoform X1 [Calidris pugnax]|uniref:39S ribosomal protein L21, mitochondrial isoform X1 n=1 Tax=Calidris pugnax TaxID=198806 RepID=UPI00071C3D5D|nr:PREDICTED: 39S ribosomal protein L21, mitochondrial isoform X1 [Calidris pugnax]
MSCPGDELCWETLSGEPVSHLSAAFPHHPSLGTGSGLKHVLLVGADDFTLIGRPLLGKELVRVEATVIEKTESWPKINMRFWKRHNYQRKKIIVHPQTVLRINTIEIFPSLS